MGDGTIIVGKVIKRAKGEDGNRIGLQKSNPLLDTREYKILMPDGKLAIDAKTCADFWREAIKKEMLNVTPTF